MSDTNAAMAVDKDLDLRLRGKCEGGTGPDLSRYPDLVYSPEGGVRTHLHGAPVDAIAADAMYLNLDESIKNVADKNGCTVGEALAALAYAYANKLI